MSLAVLCGALLYGCDSTTEEEFNEFQTGKAPPERPADAPAASGSGFAIGVRKLYLGGTDRSGSPNPSAWKDLGYNLDGLVSKAGSPNHCKPAAGGKPSIMDDGTDGTDNAFGKTLMPLILSLANDAQEQVNESLEDGDFTIIVNHTNIGSEPNQVDVLSKLYAGTGIGAEGDDPARWDGSDEWLVAPELLTNPEDIESARIQFENAYVADGTWVSGDLGDIDLSLSVAGYALTLKITRAVITMDMEGTSATNGVIAGILKTEDLISEIRKVAGGFSEEFCSGTTIESLLDQLRQASDIPINGEQSPDKTCDGISIGIGFDGDEVQLGGIDEPSPPAEDPCEGGGNEGGTGGSEGGMGGAGGMAGGAGGTGGAAGGAGGSGGSGGN
jgi:hypothetical protein